MAATNTPPDSFSVIYVRDKTSPIEVDKEAAVPVGYVLDPITTGALPITANAISVQPIANNFSNMSSIFNL